MKICYNVLPVHVTYMRIVFIVYRTYIYIVVFFFLAALCYIHYTRLNRLIRSGLFRIKLWEIHTHTASLCIVVVM